MKKIILIGNNETITDKTIQELELDSDTLIILFNHHMPLKWEKIKKHENKVVFLRYNGSTYWGQEVFNKNKKLFKKAYYLHRKYFMDEKKKVEFFSDEEYEKFGFIQHCPTSGLCAYLYVMKYLYDEDTKVYLVGFSLNYKTISSCHSKNIELNFYQEELTKNPNLIKLDK